MLCQLINPEILINSEQLVLFLKAEVSPIINYILTLKDQSILNSWHHLSKMLVSLITNSQAPLDQVDIQNKCLLSLTKY